MGDFSYKKCLYTGLTVETEKVTLAGTVEIGDLLDSGGVKADASDTNVLWIAQKAGVSGDSIPALPILGGMVFEAKSEDVLAQGAACGIKIEAGTSAQILDAGAVNPIFTCIKAAGAGEQAWVVADAGSGLS